MATSGEQKLRQAGGASSAVTVTTHEPATKQATWHTVAQAANRLSALLLTVANFSTHAAFLPPHLPPTFPRFLRSQSALRSYQRNLSLMQAKRTIRPDWEVHNAWSRISQVYPRWPGFYKAEGRDSQGESCFCAKNSGRWPLAKRLDFIGFASDHRSLFFERDDFAVLRRVVSSVRGVYSFGSRSGRLILCPYSGRLWDAQIFAANPSKSISGNPGLAGHSACVEHRLVCLWPDDRGSERRTILGRLVRFASADRRPGIDACCAALGPRDRTQAAEA